MRRALVTAPGWGDFDWEILHEKAVPPRMNLALDEVLTTRVGEGRRRPTLRIWEWDESAVVIGSFQSYRNEVDPEGAARHGFDVVRRISGGGAMMMAAGPVSYTHLDVYKRQPLASAALGLIPPVAAVIAVLTWAIAVPYGVWQLGRAAYLSVAPRREVR